MIDFDGEGFFARLSEVHNITFAERIMYFLLDDEDILLSFQNIRDGIVFTNKRIITINIQGITGKKKDFTSIPYSKITAFSLETTGCFDFDAEMEIYVTAIGKLKFEFWRGIDVNQICKILSMYVLA